MRSLQARLVLLLIGAILAVMLLATYTATRFMQPPSPQATMEPLALQIHRMMDLQGRADPQGRGLSAAPAGGTVDERMTQFLRGSLRRTGRPFAALVTRLPEDPALTASVPVAGQGWLIVEMPDLSPPPGRWTMMAVWLVLIVLGSAAISIHAARRLTRPLQLLEDAVDRVGPDGTLEPIPETGTGEVQAAARALNRLSGQLRQAMESRMRLVAAAGHDLRTPMTRMRLRAEFIEDDTEREKWLADLQELDLIADSAIRLVREEIGADGVEPVRLDALLAQIAAELRGTGLSLMLAPMPAVTVSAGPIALKRALRNLLINAATHGGGARVSLDRQGATALVRIEDDGPGVPPELLDRIFEPFFRVDQARRKSFPGAGLGMAIAREIIERQGGRITVSNRQPCGLLQLCRLPVAAPSAGRQGSG